MDRLASGCTCYDETTRRCPIHPVPNQVRAKVQTASPKRRDTARQAKMRKAAKRGQRARSESGGMKK